MRTWAGSITHHSIAEHYQLGSCVSVVLHNRVSQVLMPKDCARLYRKQSLIDCQLRVGPLLDSPFIYVVSCHYLMSTASSHLPASKPATNRLIETVCEVRHRTEHALRDEPPKQARAPPCRPPVRPPRNESAPETRLVLRPMVRPQTLAHVHEPTRHRFVCVRANVAGECQSVVVVVVMAMVVACMDAMASVPPAGAWHARRDRMLLLCQNQFTEEW